MTAADLRTRLAPFEGSAAALRRLARWLRKPPVARWFPDAAEQVHWAAAPPPGGERAWITRGERAVGYLRWTRVSRHELDAAGLFDVPSGAVDADLLLGATRDQGRGCGPQALELLVQRLAAEGGVSLLGLTTSIHNVAAQRAFAKAGFAPLRQYEPPGYGPCWLMVRRL